MLKDRIAEGIYALVSDLYYEVTAGFIATPEGAIVIDTLPFPSETKVLKKIALRECPAGIKYLILTHYHADHSLGSYLFEGVEIIASEATRTLLRREGVKRLAEAKKHSVELGEVRIVLPGVTFSGEMNLHLNGKDLFLIQLPGHSPDSVVVYVWQDKILFAGDVVMPVPYVPLGDVDAMVEATRRIKEMELEHLVQGHGGVLLKGEIPEVLDSNIAYLHKLKEKVRGVIEAGKGLEEAVEEIKIEDCGKSRIAMGSLTDYIHRANVTAVYEALKEGRAEH